MKKTKIIIAGIGGVGGYFGGLLAKKYYKSKDVEINFVARGENLKAIKKDGLKVIKGAKEFIAIPNIATSNPKEIGIADYIIVSCKSFDLENIISELKPAIDEHTLILPLLNGVDSKERIKKLLPNNTILDGCVYIVSRLTSPGIVENSGNIQTLYFGIQNTENEELNLLEHVLKNAEIEATLSKNINTIIWEKFIFISTTATATSCFNNCIGELLNNNKKLKVITDLIEEVKQIALKKGINVPESITEVTLEKLKALPFETTSSMHSDFKNKKTTTELESLTGYILKEGIKLNITTPTFESCYQKIKKLYTSIQRY